jgi:hypothetical protein
MAMVTNLVLYFVVEFGREFYEALGQSTRDGRMYRARNHFRLFFGGSILIFLGGISFIIGLIAHLHDIKRDLWIPFLIYFACGTTSMASFVIWVLYIHFNHSLWKPVWIVVIRGDITKVCRTLTSVAKELTHN